MCWSEKSAAVTHTAAHLQCDIGGSDGMLLSCHDMDRDFIMYMSSFLLRKLYFPTQTMIMNLYNTPIEASFAVLF